MLSLVRYRFTTPPDSLVLVLNSFAESVLFQNVDFKLFTASAGTRNGVQALTSFLDTWNILPDLGNLVRRLRLPSFLSCISPASFSNNPHLLAFWSIYYSWTSLLSSGNILSMQGKFVLPALDIDIVFVKNSSAIWLNEMADLSQCSFASSGKVIIPKRRLPSCPTPRRRNGRHRVAPHRLSLENTHRDRSCRHIQQVSSAETLKLVDQRDQISAFFGEGLQCLTLLFPFSTTWPYSRSTARTSSFHSSPVASFRFPSRIER